jgi:glycerol kinase
MEKKYVMAFDSGTTSNRAVIFDHDGEIVSSAQREFRQIYPKPGWVEHDPIEILETQLSVAREARQRSGINPDEIAGIGITNQRETTVVWDKTTGEPVMNAIVWQDRRTASICDRMKEKGLEDYVRENTGLVIDAYFSGTKIKWILDNVSGVRQKAERGDVLFGTIDSWLIWNLTGAKAHVTDYTNAGRTLLFNIRNVDWDDTLISELGIPRAMLPELHPTSEVYGHVDPNYLFGNDGGSSHSDIPVAAAVGDQHGALFGQACFEPGMVKCTYGTGGSLLMNTGSSPMESTSGLLTTMAWGLNGKVEYAIEGLLFIMGASVQWLRDELEMVASSAETEELASQVEDTNGVYVVPAFTGLSAPYWDQYARGTVVGLTRGANRKHFVRATLESMAYQIKDVITCMENDSGCRNTELKVDGGAANNNFLMQFQADLLGVPVLRPKIVESTARGSAFLAGLATGFWKDQSELVDTFELDRRFEPRIGEAQRNELYAGWKRAVERAKDWELH